MDIPDYPPNSEASKREPTEEKQIKRVTSEEPRKRKKTLRQQFTDTLVAGNAKSAMQYVVIDVLIPSARDMIVESFEGWIRSLVLGDSRRKGTTPPMHGPSGYVTYNRMSRQTAPQRVLSRQARAGHDFDELVLQSRTEAEGVIDQLYEVVSRYGEASVADFYGMVGMNASHTDNKWGWTNLRGAGVTKVREGFLLDLPEPQPLG